METKSVLSSRIARLREFDRLMLRLGCLLILDVLIAIPDDSCRGSCCHDPPLAAYPPLLLSATLDYADHDRYEYLSQAIGPRLDRLRRRGQSPPQRPQAARRGCVDLVAARHRSAGGARGSDFAEHFPPWDRVYAGPPAPDRGVLRHGSGRWRSADGIGGSHHLLPP